MKRFKLEYDKAHVAESLERIKTVARGGIPDRVPLIFNASFDKSRSYPKRDPAPQKYNLFDDEQDLAWWMASRQGQIDAFPEGDHYPWVWAGNPFSQAMVPSLFGAKVVNDGTGVANIEGRLIQNLETDLDRLPRRIDPEKDGLGPRLRQRLEHWVQATDGKMAIMPFDWQSPYGVACLLMSNEDLMLAMYDTPDLVHELFRRATQAIVDLIQAAQRWIGDPELCLLNNQMFFKGSGMTLHDDYISVLSPELHGRFCHPCNMRLYQEFGIGHLHTCGPVFPGYIDALTRHQGLRSMDISAYLRGTSRTRADLLEFKRRARAAGITLTGNPSICEQIGRGPETPPDRELFDQMAEGGGLILNWLGGTREYGLKLLKWGTDCYSTRGIVNSH